MPTYFYRINLPLSLKLRLRIKPEVEKDDGTAIQTFIPCKEVSGNYHSQKKMKE